MAGRIQGITVEIGGDTTKLQTALKDEMRIQMRAVPDGEERVMIKVLFVCHGNILKKS